MTHSPYLHEPPRLAEVLSAIQVMGTYRFYTLGFAGWLIGFLGMRKRKMDSRLLLAGMTEEDPEFFPLFR